MEQFPALLRSQDRQPVRYLVVDDSVFARKNLTRMIETFGGLVAGEAGDGCTAITEYDRVSPDIVLMDITMPQMEGIEAAERIVRSAPIHGIAAVAGGIVPRDRPEGLCRRRGAFVKRDCVIARPVKRLAGLVAEIERIDRVLW